MHDLTQGSVARHILKLTVMMFVGMVMQTLYLLLDLYFVGRLGSTAVAAVSVAGNLAFAVTAATQVIAVGTSAVVSHAAGVKDHALASARYQQAQLLSLVIGAAFMAGLSAARSAYVTSLSADAATARAASEYLTWFVPALALQFPLFTSVAALRGTGNFGFGLLLQTGSVLLNILLAPVLIFGWGIGQPLGVRGAALASFIAISAALIVVNLYVRFSPNSYLGSSKRRLRPDLQQWWEVLKIGLPAGAELGLLTLYIFVVYVVSRPFGTIAQAGFGVGFRVVQAGVLPAVALGIALTPVAGQNFAAGLSARVCEAFRVGTLIASALMGALTLLLYFARTGLISPFSSEPPVLATGAEYLAITAWMLVPTGLNFVCASLFQAMGHTLPSLAAAGIRYVLLFAGIFAAARAPGFELRSIWYLSLATIVLQLALNLLLLRRELARRLPREQPRAPSFDAAVSAAPSE